MLTQDNRKLHILRSFGENFPIIHAWQCEPSKLFVLHVKEGQLRSVINYLSNKHTPKVDSFTSMKELHKILTDNTSLVICSYVPNKKSDEMVSKLAMINKSGTCMTDVVTACPVVVMEGVLCGFPSENVFSVYYEGDIEALVQESIDVIPPDNQVSVVADKLTPMIQKTHNPEKKALLAATCFLYPNLKKNNRGEDMDGFLREVDEMVRQDEDNKQLADIDTAFVKELYRWQDDNQFTEVHELPYLGINAVKNVHGCIFYDENYAYVSSFLFKLIVQKMLAVFSGDVLKNELTKAGIIKGDGAGTYTAKMSYVDLAGINYRERMIRLDREKLSVPGEIDFIEQCELRKEIRDD